jgi:hypothetical protein
LVRRDPHPRIEQADLDRDIAAIKAKNGPSAFEVAYDSGRGMTLAEAVALAVRARVHDVTPKRKA